jgi:translation initiation factor 1 (eIF-1/SUI1)
LVRYDSQFFQCTICPHYYTHHITIENAKGKSLATISNEQKQQIEQMKAVVELAKEMAQATPILDHQDVPTPRQRMWQFHGDDMQPLIDAVTELEVAIGNADGNGSVGTLAKGS